MDKITKRTRLRVHEDGARFFDATYEIPDKSGAVIATVNITVELDAKTATTIPKGQASGEAKVRQTLNLLLSRKQ